jgi:S1-C subfamily serine protease
MRKLVSYVAIFVLGFAVCAGVLAAISGGNPISGITNHSKQVVLAALETPTSPEPQSPVSEVIEKAAATVEPSIVTIDTESRPIPQDNPFGGGGNDFFRQFFGGQEPQMAPQVERGAASGVIISSDGYVLTNNHVVSNAATVKVNLADGKAFRAKVIGTDPVSDIAVVKIQAPGETLTPAQLGDSGSLKIGESVIAVGNPLDVGITVTHGIVSALGHRNGLQAGPHPLASNIIQTDAAINPGNSGGALADTYGRVIGINEAIYSPTGTFSGIGFAIPIDTAKSIAAQLISTGHVVRPYIGISYMPLKDIDQQSRQQIGVTLSGDDGMIVAQVSPNSPAASAGLQQYDVILEANRQKLSTQSSLQDEINKLKPGDKLVLLVSRNGHDMIVPVTIGQMPANFGSEMEQPEGGPQGMQPMPGPDNGGGGDGF